MDTAQILTLVVALLAVLKVVLLILKRKQDAEIVDVLIDAVENAPMAPATREQLKRSVETSATTKNVDQKLDDLVQAKFPKMKKQNPSSWL